MSGDLDLRQKVLGKKSKNILPNGGEFNGDFHPMGSNP